VDSTTTYFWPFSTSWQANAGGIGVVDLFEGHELREGADVGEQAQAGSPARSWIAMKPSLAG
jgi:hypothetical protein